MRVSEAGVDTWKPSWYVETGSPIARGLNELATVGSGRGRLLPDTVAGHRLGWLRGIGLVWAEGHPSGDDRTLGSADELAAMLEHIEREMADRGLPLPQGVAFDFPDNLDSIRAGGATALSTPTNAVARPGLGLAPSYLPGDSPPRRPGFAGLGRVDSTVNISCESTAEGLAILTGLAAVARTIPGLKPKIIGAATGSHLETIELRTRGGRQMNGRCYDKGVESGRQAPGLLLRLEDQRRFPKLSRRGVEEMATEDVRGLFKSRFEPFAKATEGVLVAGPFKAGERLLDLVEHGRLSWSKAETLAGHLFLSELAAAIGKGKTLSRASFYRRSADLRAAGVILADGILDQVEVNLHDVVNEALESDAWDARGCPVQLAFDVQHRLDEPTHAGGAGIPGSYHHTAGGAEELLSEVPAPIWLSHN